MLRLTDNAGDVNDVRVARDGDDYVLADSLSPITAGAGCTQDGANQARCAADGIIQIIVSLGGGADRGAIVDGAYPPELPTGQLPVSVAGGAGNDTLQGADGPEQFAGGAGADTISAAGGNDALFGFGDIGTDEDDELHGGPGQERTLNGGPGNDRVFAGEGDDGNVAGDAGDDLVDGGAGDDDLIGGTGDDVLQGAAGADTIDVPRVDPTLAFGRDTLDGGPGDDELGTGGAAPLEPDTMRGGDGFDTTSYADRIAPVTVTLDGVADDGESGENDNVLPDVEKIVGGADADRIVGGPGPDVLDGGPSDDLVIGLGGDDTLEGGPSDSGSDSLSGGPGADAMRGGPGDDSLAGGDGDDGIGGGGGSDALAGDAGSDTLAGGPGLDALTGGDGDDVVRGGDVILVGADGADELAGDGGDDLLFAGPGNDRLDGGAGADAMHGEDGRDSVSYETRSAPVTVTFDGQANDGEADENDNVADDVELVLGGTVNDTLSGDERENALGGGSGEDVIAGLGGSDTLTGGGAADVVRARDGARDVVSCGRGGDLALLDRSDTARGCEFVDRSGGAPVARRAASVRVLSGRAAFRLPGAGRFVGLGERVALPMRTALDARAGRVRVATAARRRRPARQSATFWDGVFSVRQAGRRRPVTEIRLRGGDFGACTAAPARTAARASRLRPPVRRVWGRGRGRYRTRGRYSSGVVRGTTWLTEDRCEGTLTRVIRGTVVVHDFVRRRTVVVRAGEQYLARAPAAAARGGGG